MPRANARRAYYARAHYVRNRRRQALAVRLALSTHSGEPNRAGTPGGDLLIPVPGPNNVFIDKGAAYEEIRGNTIVFVPAWKLWDVDRSFAFGLNDPDIVLTSR